MQYTISIIVEGTIVVGILYLLSFLIENRIKFLYLLWSNLKAPKNKFMADGAAVLAALFYFFVNLLVLFNDLRAYHDDPEGFSFLVWFVLVLLLAIIFGKIHLKFTPIDPTKNNFDNLNG